MSYLAIGRCSEGVGGADSPDDKSGDRPKHEDSGHSNDNRLVSAIEFHDATVEIRHSYFFSDSCSTKYKRFLL